MNVPELSEHIDKSIQGMFGPADMAVMKTEIEKLKPGEIYLEIGVDEGHSMAVASHYAKPGVFVVGVDIHDVSPVDPYTIGRGPFAEQEGVIGFEKKGFFVHGDADEFANLWTKPINLIFIDGGHDYEEVKKNCLRWEPFMAKGSVMLFHDIDYSAPGPREFLDDYFGKGNWEALHGKIGRVQK
jgi:predicted O-methyltransferase YrrM